ncbi:sialidase family protein [Kineococcus sp. SYSU DK003]|uniref:sialidase family protein n=1 Tax=Kineococcus sp. SYSU DK003 TaxID=3383124 RepID=UPI003D7E8C88
MEFTGTLQASGNLRHGFLPAPTVQCHAANLALLPTGELACTWFGGTQEGVADIDVWLSRLAPGSDVWSTPERLSGDPDRSEQNPVLWTTPTGEVWLLHTAQHAGNQDTAEVRRRISTDGGRTFGPTGTFVPADGGGGVFVRQVPVVTRSGRWILPLFRCPVTPGARWRGDDDDSVTLVSDDAGATWRQVDVPASRGMVHMNIAVRPDGTLVALYRSRFADAVHRSESSDDGDTWSAPEPTPVPNNNSSVQVTTAPDGRLLLVHNRIRATDDSPRRESLYDEIDDLGVAGQQESAPVEHTGGGAVWGTPRAPLSLAVSRDGGSTWPVCVDLETGDGNCLTNDSRQGANHELSYPSVLVTDEDGTAVVHVAYTWHRRAIRYARFPLAALGGAG